MPRILILVFLIALVPLPLSRAIELTNISGKATTLAAQIMEHETLVYIVADENELREAQRLLTIPNKNRQTLIIIETPANDQLKVRAMRNAAKRFFKSKFSQKHVFLATRDQPDFPAFKSLLLTPRQVEPIWSSNELTTP